MNVVYPLGYSTPGAGERIEELLSSQNTLLIDTRIKPYSWNELWRKKALEQKYGDKYRWAGKYLGNAALGTGRIELADADTGIRGLTRYLNEQHDLILLCQCQQFEKCHVNTICNLLVEKMPEVEVIRFGKKEQQPQLFNVPKTALKQVEMSNHSTPETGLGKCIKCGGPAVLRSPSGATYCKRCGRCQRRVYGTMRGVAVLREECKKSVEEFVLHPRMGIYVCPCVLSFEQKMLKERKIS